MAVSLQSLRDCADSGWTRLDKSIGGSPKRIKRPWGPQRPLRPCPWASSTIARSLRNSSLIIAKACLDSLVAMPSRLSLWPVCYEHYYCQVGPTLSYTIDIYWLPGCILFAGKACTALASFAEHSMMLACWWQLRPSQCLCHSCRKESHQQSKLWHRERLDRTQMMIRYDPITSVQRKQVSRTSKNFKESTLQTLPLITLDTRHSTTITYNYSRSAVTESLLCSAVLPCFCHVFATYQSISTWALEMHSQALASCSEPLRRWPPAQGLENPGNLRDSP